MCIIHQRHTLEKKWRQQSLETKRILLTLDRLYRLESIQFSNNLDIPRDTVEQNMNRDNVLKTIQREVTEVELCYLR